MRSKKSEEKTVNNSAIEQSFLANEKIICGYRGTLCELLFVNLLVLLIQP